MAARALTPEEWGPVVWKFLHMVAYRLDSTHVGQKRLLQPVKQTYYDSNSDYAGRTVQQERYYQIYKPQLELTHLMFQKLLIDLSWVLPCSSCANHFKYFISKSTVEIGPQASLITNRSPLQQVALSLGNASEYIVNLHNKVNAHLRKPTPTFSQVQSKLLHDGATDLSLYAFLVLLCITYGYEPSMYDRYKQFVDNFKQLLYELGEQELAVFLHSFCGFDQTTPKSLMLRNINSAYLQFCAYAKKPFITDAQMLKILNVK